MIKTVGIYMSSKKWHKLNMDQMKQLLADRHIDMIKIDLGADLEKQGPFAAIIHKLSEDAAKAKRGDSTSLLRLEAFENFTKAHPETILFDPLDGLWILLDRSRQYKLIEQSECAAQGMVYAPAFVELFDLTDSLEKIRRAGVKFPAVCKPIVAHGSSQAHQMSLVFTEDGLKDIRTPCIVQSFINHGARLYKLFVLGSKFYVVERPSIKDFQPGDIHSTIHFDAHNISKPESSCPLNMMDSGGQVCPEPSPALLQSIVSEFREKLNLKLFGIDVIVDTATGRHAIIDMNVFPGYDGVSTFLEDLADLICDTIASSNIHPPQVPRNNISLNSLQEDDTGRCKKFPAPLDQMIMDKTENLTDVTSNEPSMVSSMVKLMSSKCNESNNHDIDSGIDSCDEKKKKSKGSQISDTILDQSQTSVLNGRGKLVRCRNVISSSTQVSL